MQTNELTRKQFAQLNSWSPSYITKLGDQGRLVLTPDGKKVKVAETMALIADTAGSRDDVTQRHAEGRAAQAGGFTGNTPGADGGDASMAQARKVKAVSEARRLAALADQEEMERDRLAGTLLQKEDVDFALNDYGATLRGLLENLADRLAPVVYPLKTLDETHAAISEAVDALQDELAETMHRRMEALGAQ
jgi:phage terminase Nu1 subunit (DNA packaging protein)